MRVQAGWEKRIAKVLETFCAEAAVLLLVFPMLDKFIQYGVSGISAALIIGSLSGAVFFLGIAVSIATFVREEEQ